MTLTVLEQIVVFMLDIRLWTGRKRLQPEDLAANGIDPDKLPPGTLASLGSKKVIGPEALAPFFAIKREAEKILLATGVRFLGGYAVPAEQAPQLAARLDGLRGQFDQAKGQLLQHYDQAIQAWIADNPPTWAPVIRAAVEPVAQVDKSLHFAYTPVAVAPPDTLSDTAELESQAEGLYGQLCHEVRVAARALFEQSFVGRTSITRKALRPIRALRTKLESLAFLDPQVGAAVRVIDETLDRLPATGPIDGADLNMLAGLVGRQLARLGEPVVEEPEEAETLAEDAPSRTSPAAYPVPAQAALPLAWDF